MLDVERQTGIENKFLSINKIIAFTACYQWQPMRIFQYILWLPNKHIWQVDNIMVEYHSTKALLNPVSLDKNKSDSVDKAIYKANRFNI